MPSYNAPLEDFEYLIREYLKIDEYQSLDGFADARELVTPLLDEAAKFCENVIFPLNQSGDEEGLKYDDGKVITPAGFKEAYKQYCDAGWMSFTCDSKYGGQGLPEVLNMPMIEMTCSSNLAFGMTPGLSHGAYSAIHHFASDELKQTYLPKMVTGEWSGVMCLTEPHCGTDLGLIYTKAEPANDGSFNITGGKIFISSGEQDKTENIIHLVLAKLPDAPEGVRGISLFLVPKVMVNEDGSLGDRNGVRCESIEHKMGIHASPTCVMNYDNAKGYLVGEPNKGLKAMFTMMNEARLLVGIQGLGLAEVSWQNAKAYAQERLQGRALKGGPAAPEKAADPIIVHPDVRRMLLTMKSFTEGARALALETALKLDILKRSDNEEDKEQADHWMQLMTPIIKAYYTDMGFAVSSEAMQVHGGFGYIKEYGVEQYTRDARIAMIYEGTNGIQGLDLIGRKLPYKFGKYARVFFHPVTEFIEENRVVEGMAEFTKPLYQNIKHLQNATLWLAKTGMGNPNDPAAGATEYLRMFALCVMGYVWARQAKLALEKIESGDGLHSKEFYEAKLDTARFFMQRQLPDCVSLLLKITNGSKSIMKAAI
ncbi:MAG: acyl-CoA dehydrogenase C-terminal domain-containing protein [Rickettsiales bacterium]|nr:acyl-CoA dehydrogenase C-terminal domain-containing protein [Rickettsiales bacterium]